MNISKTSAVLSFLMIAPLFASEPFHEDNVPVDPTTQCPLFDTNSLAFKVGIMQFYDEVVTVNGMKWRIGFDKSAASRSAQTDTFVFLGKEEKNDGCRYRYSYVRDQIPQEYLNKYQQKYPGKTPRSLHDVFVLIPVKEDV